MARGAGNHVRVIYRHDGGYVRIHASGAAYVKSPQGCGLAHKEFPTPAEAVAWYGQFGYTKEWN